VTRRHLAARCRALALGATVASGVLALAPSPAQAQQWLLGGEGTVSTGLEAGGDPRGVFRRTRTTARIGVDARIDERPNEIFSAGVIVELEPRTSFGLDVRYGRLLSPNWTVDAGVVGFLKPETLFGVTAGATMRDRPGRGFAFTVGPRINLFFLGSDLPTSRPIWQVLVCGGFHVDL
jgi:hypothetical protein